MAIRHYFALLIGTALGGALLAMTPATAQDDPAAALDTLSRTTATVESGTALAREQMRQGDLTGALATLERVLMEYPEPGVLLLHAGLLCRLDDRDGARAEIAELGGREIPGDAWREMTAACGPLPRPGMGG